MARAAGGRIVSANLASSTNGLQEGSNKLQDDLSNICTAALPDEMMAPIIAGMSSNHCRMSDASLDLDDPF